VKLGDRVVVYPGERIPASGRVLRGTGLVDEHELTGASNLVARRTEGQVVHASTLLLQGQLCVLVKRVGNNTRVGIAMQLLQAAPVYDTRVEDYASKMANLAIAPTLGLSAAIFALTGDVSRALAPLHLDFGHGIRLAVPTTVLAALTYAARHGIYIRSGRALEVLSRIDTIAFDKTGTLTEGRPSITDAIDYGVSENFMRHCASLETWSEHPAGKAIAAGWKGERLPVEEFRAIPGMGVTGVIGGQQWLAGTQALLQKEAVPFEAGHLQQAETLRKEGKTVIFIACETRLAGLIGLIDTLREEAPAMVGSLRALGLEPIMLTGDNKAVARYVAGRCGIADVRAGLDPLGKADAIRALKKSGTTVLMAGDGINDAPALTEADTGLTLGSATGIALESAGVAILNDDLRLVALLIAHARRSFAIIRQNLFWAFGYNTLALPLAMTGMLHPIVAAILMASSSLVVVGNSLRLRKT